VSNAAWETLSNQAVAAAGLVYFVALLVHLVEWAALRQPQERAVSRLAGARTSTTGDAAVAEEEPPARRTTPERVAFLARLGFLLTCIAAGAHFVGLLGRGMAADPNRVPWGNMYEFTVSGTFVVTVMYLALYKKLRLGWMAPLVVGFVVTVLMVAVIWLHEPVQPLREALNSYWLVIHVVSAVIATGAFTLGGLCSVLAGHLPREKEELWSPDGTRLVVEKATPRAVLEVRICPADVGAFGAAEPEPQSGE